VPRGGAPDGPGFEVSAESFLSSAVEAAVAMAGFAGIVAAIRNREISRWPHEQRILLRMLLIASAMSVTFAMLPAVLAEARQPEPSLWRASSLALLVWQAAIAVHRQRQFRSGGTASPVPRILYLWVTSIVLAFW